MSFPSPTRRKTRRSEQGYIMLILLLAIALMTIFVAAIVPTIAFEIRRDREEEMIHRGVQYSRAIRGYYKKFGRYPVKLEDLEGTNNLRFLRKRYKDPLNCKKSKCEDFRLLHFGEVQMTLSGISGGAIPGASPIGANSGSNGPGGLSQSSTFGGSSGFGANSSSSFGGSSSSFGGSNSSFGSSTSSFGNSTSGFGQNQSTAGNPASGSDPSQAGSTPGSVAGSGDQSAGAGTNSSGPNGPGPGGSNQLGSGQIIGGPIVGVASNATIKDSTIREFNHKTKYKDWAFVYDPAQDQGRLITTPYQQQVQGFGQGTPNLNGQNGSNTGSAFGTSGGFGNNNSNSFGTSSSGFGNSPNSPASGGFGQPSQPSNPPAPQQQQ